ncbi:unnamed protein product [Schistosoma margrebowiei]|uniref:Uncharacterized protein n=1 Tax=Schistosoma margrebowiei TaxID=48269 RepID=A0A183N5R0_9TREM|nr:unnamed protein product [Schistosoma margrebowiei]
MVVGGCEPETLDLGFLLLDTRQKGLRVTVRELMLLDGFDIVSPSFTVRDITTELSGLRLTCRTINLDQILTMKKTYAEFMFRWN